MDPKSEPKPAKRPYEAPAVEETGDFERLVLACAHTPSGGPACTDPMDPEMTKDGTS